MFAGGDSESRHLPQKHGVGYVSVSRLLQQSRTDCISRKRPLIRIRATSLARQGIIDVIILAPHRFREVALAVDAPLAVDALTGSPVCILMASMRVDFASNYPLV